VTALSAGALWRKHYTLFPPRLSLSAARSAGIPTDAASRAKALSRRYLGGLRTPPPPKGWTAVDFDDSSWLLEAGAEFTTGDTRMPGSADLAYARGTDPGVKEAGLICLRGRFVVKDPSAVRSLSLALTYRGGFVAYLNGEEVARGSLPSGRLDYDAPAEPYDLDAFLAPADAKGNRKSLHWWTHKNKKFLPYWARRERHFGPAVIDPRRLRKGVNVLALELHRSDYPACCRNRKVGLCFASVGLSELFLRARAPVGSIVAPTDRPEGLQVWAVPAWESVREDSFLPPGESPGTIEIIAVRNGAFAGQAVVASTSPIDRLSASVGELTSDAGGRIPPAAVKVRFGALNPTQPGTSRGSRRWRLTGVHARRFDALLEQPPARVEPVRFAKPSRLIRESMGLPPAPRPAAVVPIYITVNVPADAPAGLYRGTLTVSAGGGLAGALPIRLSVAEWTLPEVKDYVSLINIYQSPETLARYYKVAPWSQEHWRLIQRSMRLMGQIGNIGLFFPLLAESQFGNPDSMVVWIRRPDAGYDYDFKVFDRYLQTALKYHDRLRFLAVCAYGRGAAVTVLDPASGKKTLMPLPEYGTPECEKLLRPLLLAVRRRLEAKGLGNLMLLGLPADRAPNWKCVAMFHRILPTVAWARESHFDARGYRYDPKDRRAVVPVAYNSIVWGGAVPDPAAKRLYGWRYDPKHLIMTFNRAGASALNLHGFPPPWSYRIWMETTLAGGRNGNGRVGGDYWRLGVRVRSGGRRISSEAEGGSGGTLFGSYLRSSVGQVGLGNSTSDLFAPGPEGPVTTVRFENAREGNQAAEVRIFIERALLDKDHPLPAALARKCQTILDERTNALRMNTLGRSLGRQFWAENTRRLFRCAAEVARKLRQGGA